MYNYSLARDRFTKMSNYSKLHLKALQTQLEYLKQNKIYNHKYNILRELEINNWTKRPLPRNHLTKSIKNRKQLKVRLQ